MTTIVGEHDQLTKPRSALQVESALAAPPCAMVIFGAAGDLTKRLIVPALYNLVNAKRLSNGFRLVAVDHNARTVEQWRAARMTYLQGDFTDPGTYSRLRDHLRHLDSTAGNYLFYLAVSDRFFSTAIHGLATASLVTEGDGHWRRVVIEKPFGHDLPSANALNAEILKALREGQIYRIDHFLGKETVQNIMALRFANGMF